MFNVLTSAAATFFVLPAAYEASAPWVRMHVLSSYPVRNIDNAMLAWKVLLGLLIFAGARAALKLALSAASLALAMRVIRMARGR